MPKEIPPWSEVRAPLGECPHPTSLAMVTDMATALIVPPATFIEHATRLRARKLEKVASQVEQEIRIRSVSGTKSKAPRKDLSSVLRHFRGRLS